MYKRQVVTVALFPCKGADMSERHLPDDQSSTIAVSYTHLDVYKRQRFVCQNGCVCGQSLGEVRVPHRGNVVEKVIEGAYEVVGLSLIHI